MGLDLMPPVCANEEEHSWNIISGHCGGIVETNESPHPTTIHQTLDHSTTHPHHLLLPLPLLSRYDTHNKALTMPNYALSVVTLLATLVSPGSSFTRVPLHANTPNAEGSSTLIRHASATTSIPLDTSFLAEAEKCKILEPKGKHHPWYSLEPLNEGAEWAATPGPYFKKMIAQNNNEPVFKIHPGLGAIAITDHASGKWFFDQPDTVLDRQVP